MVETEEEDNGVVAINKKNKQYQQCTMLNTIITEGDGVYNLWPVEPTLASVGKATTMKEEEGTATYAKVKVAGKDIETLIDTGAAVSVIVMPWLQYLQKVGKVVKTRRNF